MKETNYAWPGAGGWPVWELQRRQAEIEQKVAAEQAYRTRLLNDYGIEILSTSSFDPRGDGETSTTIYIVRGKLAKIRKWADLELAPYRCHHEYDCCGHFYRHYPPTIKTIQRWREGVWMVVDELQRNV